MDPTAARYVRLCSACLLFHLLGFHLSKAAATWKSATVSRTVLSGVATDTHPDYSPE